MAGKYGCLNEFHPEVDSIRAYLELVTLYFKANDIGEGKRVPILLSSIGTRIYSLLRDLVAPESPGDLSFARISEVLSAHFQPRRFVIAERFQFHRHSQAAEEGIAEFDAALRSLATHCEFGDTLEETLRDRFVCGLRHEATQRRLLMEHDLTYQKALEIAKGMEAADSNTAALKNHEPLVHKVKDRVPQATERKTCFRCGRTGHFPKECRFKDALCHACGKKGHIAPVCKSAPHKKSFPRQGHPGRSRQRFKRTNRVQDDEDSGSSSEEYLLHKVGNCSTDPVNVYVQINGKPLKMEVDTGATLSIISEETRKAMFPEEELRTSGLVLKTYTNEPMQVKGTLNVRVQYETQFKKLVLVVIAGNGPSLFGRNWLNHIKLNWKEMFKVRSVRLGSLHALMQPRQKLFGEGLGKVEPYRASLHIQERAKATFL